MAIATTNPQGKLPTTAPTNPDYDFTIDELEKIRICMQGSLAVKKAGYLLLPHPSQIDQSSEEQLLRYKDYLANAEYKNDGAATKRQLLGKMRLDDMKIELPEQLLYLEENSDGNGLSLRDAIKLAVGETMEMKTHFLVSDFKGLSDVDLSQISLAEQKELNPRAYTKHYTRDSLTNWSFKTINGRNQLSYLQFREVGTEFDTDSGTHNQVESYLILALDDAGNYYQQKKIYNSDSGNSIGERNYVEVKGMPLKYIPVTIISDEPLQPGRLPVGMGFLHPIIDVSLHRYRMSAKYKETQTANIPTKWTRGWVDRDLELFSEINKRDYQVTGGYGINNFPGEVEVGVSSASADMGDFHWDFERYDKEVAKLGGTNANGNMSNMTATESEMIAANQNALLESLAMSAEQGFKQQCVYNGVFMGLYSPDDIEQNVDDIIIDLPRDFAKSKLSVDEVRVLIELRMQRSISENEFHRQLKNGGWMISEVEDMITEMEEEAPRMALQSIEVDEGRGA